MACNLDARSRYVYRTIDRTVVRGIERSLERTSRDAENRRGKSGLSRNTGDCAFIAVCYQRELDQQTRG